MKDSKELLNELNTLKITYNSLDKDYERLKEENQKLKQELSKNEDDLYDLGKSLRKQNMVVMSIRQILLRNE